jgi:hypothetical protein
MDEELEIVDKPVMLSRRYHRWLKILNAQRGNETLSETVGFLLLNDEDIKKIADKENTDENV